VRACDLFIPNLLTYLRIGCREGAQRIIYTLCDCAPPPAEQRTQMLESGQRQSSKIPKETQNFYNNF